MPTLLRAIREGGAGAFNLKSQTMWRRAKRQGLRVQLTIEVHADGIHISATSAHLAASRSAHVTGQTSVIAVTNRVTPAAESGPDLGITVDESNAER